MRKLLLLITALLTLGVSGVWAFDSSKRYYIIEASTQRYVASGVTSAEGVFGLQPKGTFGDVFTLTDNGEGAYTITNANGQSLGATHAWNTTNATSAWTIAESTLADGTYTLQSVKGYLNYQGTGSESEKMLRSLYTEATEAQKEENSAKKVYFYIQEILVPANKFAKVNSEKANTFTPSTSGNDYWYVMTQTRGGESPMYDVGTDNVIYRAATGTAIRGLAVENAKYFVRFLETGTSGVYNVQFATGDYVYANNPTSNGDIKTSLITSNATNFKVYNINSENTHIGWNVTTDGSTYGKRVDNNGAGKTVSIWDDGSTTGQILSTGENNDWSIYSVEFVDDVEITYTVSDQNNVAYIGTYETAWYGDATAVPSIPGAYGATFTNKVFTESAGVYSMTANIDFGFPVSSNSVNNATAIRSALGTSLWYAKDGKVIADNSANTPNPIYNTFADNYRWYIYPVFDNGTFSFKLYNVGAAKYIPSNPSTGSNTATTLTADAASAGAFQFAHYSQGNGFYDTATSKFLTINSSGAAQNIWLWGGYGSGTHQGSVMSFPALTVVSVSDEFATLKNATKFDILEGSTVVGPSEFAAPAEINAAIDAAQNVADTDEAKWAFIQSENGTMIKNYLDQVATYGALANIKITMSKENGTMILPCPATRISGLDIYSCSAQVNGVLTLTPVEGNYKQNVPYIIHATKGSKYTIIGWDKGGTETYTAGWLTGVLNSDTEIPSGSYMLATNKTTDVQAFYKVEGTGVKCAINKCYLTVPSEPSAGVKAFYFDEDGKTTSIEEIFGGEAEQGAIYNLAGQRLQKLQKGINIINGKKIIK